MWFSTKLLPSAWFSKRLALKLIGPFPVIKQINPAFHLQLPTSMKVHPAFYRYRYLLLREAPFSLHTRRRSTFPYAGRWGKRIWTGHYTVYKGKCLEYLVQQKGYPDSERSRKTALRHVWSTIGAQFIGWHKKKNPTHKNYYCCKRLGQPKMSKCLTSMGWQGSQSCQVHN